LSVLELTILLAGAVLGGVVQGVSGFAFGMVALAVWAWGLEPVTATVMAVFGGLCGQVLSALSIRRQAKASEILPFLVGGLLGVPLGTYWLPQLDASTFKTLLGAVLTLGCPLMLRSEQVRVAELAGRLGDSVAGFAGGIIGGLSGMTGVAPAIWGTLRGFDKPKQRELLQNFNIAILTATLVALTWKGAVTSEMLPQMGIVAGALVVPSFIGARIYTRMPDAHFRRLVLILLTVAGITLLSSGLAVSATPRSSPG
jgi:uncharacterized protein